MFAESAPVPLTGHLAKLDFNSMKGQWLLDLNSKTTLVPVRPRWTGP